MESVNEAALLALMERTGYPMLQVLSLIVASSVGKQVTLPQCTSMMAMFKAVEFVYVVEIPFYFVLF